MALFSIRNKDDKSDWIKLPGMNYWFENNKVWFLIIQAKYLE